LGFVTGLGYRNPHLSPFGEFQRWKQHPAICAFLEGGKRVSYGARVINEGGWQSVPKLAFPGGVLVGCAAGFVNVPRIKGSHTAMKSGMLAAEAVVQALGAGRGGDVLADYETALRSSWIAKELAMVRNVQPLIAKFGAVLGTLLAGAEMWMRTLGIGLPYTMGHESDRKLWREEDARPIAYPAPDGVISFDRLSSVFISNTNHEEDQPIHLRLADPATPVARNLPLYGEPAQLYCPAGVYEVAGHEEGRRASLSTRRTACIARPATSRTLPATSPGSRRRGRWAELPQYVTAQGPGICLRALSRYLIRAKNRPSLHRPTLPSEASASSIARLARS
jgi:electron-transferring-flavoprotein dehydrogenase